jgi:hypothetical protein
MTLLDRYAGDVAAAASMPADQAVPKLADTIYSAFTETCGNSVQRGSHQGTFPEDPTVPLPETTLQKNGHTCPVPQDISAGLSWICCDGQIVREEVIDAGDHYSISGGAAAVFGGPVVMTPSHTSFTGEEQISLYAYGIATKYISSVKTETKTIYTHSIYKYGGGGYDWFTLSADGGPDQVISDNDEMKVLGGDGIVTTCSATDTVTIKMDMAGSDAGAYSAGTDVEIKWHMEGSGSEKKLRLYIDHTQLEAC